MEATPRARRVLDALDGAMGLIRQGLRDGVIFDPARAAEEFDLLISDLGEIVYLPTLMAYLQRHAPLARVRVRQLARGGYAEALEAGLADLAERLQDDAAHRRLRGVFVELFAHEAAERPVNLVADADAYGHYSPG